MSSLRLALVVLSLVCQFFLLPNAAFAHPASGIVVDVEGRVYFVYRGVMRIDPSGKLTSIHEDKGGHWLALAQGAPSHKCDRNSMKGSLLMAPYLA